MGQARIEDFADSSRNQKHDARNQQGRPEVPQLCRAKICHDDQTIDRGHKAHDDGRDDQGHARLYELRRDRKTEREESVESPDGADVGQRQELRRDSRRHPPLEPEP